MLCSKCSTCQLYGTNICPTCSQCKSLCSVTFEKVSDITFQISYNIESLEIDLFSLQAKYFENYLSGEQGKILFYSQISKQFYIDMSLIKSFNCLTFSTFSFVFKVQNTEESQPIANILSSINENKEYARSSAGLLSFFRINSATFIKLVNINQLIDYLYYAQINISGFSFETHKKIVLKNKDKNSPFDILNFFLNKNAKMQLLYSNFKWREYKSIVVGTFNIKSIILIILFIFLKMFKRIRKNTNSIFQKIRKYDNIKDPKSIKNLEKLLKRKVKKNKNYSKIIWWRKHRYLMFFIEHVVNRTHKNRYYIYDTIIQTYIADFGHGFGKLIKANMLFPKTFAIPTFINCFIMINCVLFILEKIYNHYLYLYSFKKLKSEYKLEIILLRNSIINTIYIFFFTLLSIIFSNYTSLLVYVLFGIQLLYIIIKNTLLIKIEEDFLFYLLSDIMFLILIIYCKVLQKIPHLDENYMLFDILFVMINLTKLTELFYIIYRNAKE